MRFEYKKLREITAFEPERARQPCTYSRSISPFGAVLPKEGTRGDIVKLTFCGTSSTNGSCPSIYQTDRDTLVIQGWRVTDPEALDALEARGLPAHETAVEIPLTLLAHLPSARRRLSETARLT